MTRSAAMVLCALGLLAGCSLPAAAAEGEPACTRPLTIHVHPKGRIYWRYKPYTVEALPERISQDNAAPFDCLRIVDVTKGQADRQAISRMLKQHVQPRGSETLAIVWEDYVRPAQPAKTDEKDFATRAKEAEQRRADYERQVSEQCRVPTRLTALASGDYELEGRTYSPQQLVEAVNASDPRPGCLRIQGERHDPVLGDRMYWLGERLQGIVLSWPPPSKALCANDASGLADMSIEACASLPPTEFAPLTAAQYQDLKREHSSLSGCVLGYQVRHRGITGSLSDDRIQRRLAKDGALPAMKTDVAAHFPGLAPAPPPGGKLGKGEFGEVQGLSWALIYRATQQGTLVDALRARSLYAKYMAMGTEGECRPSVTFTQLLEKSKPR